MKAAFYETTGAPSEVLQVGELDDPTPGPGDVRVRIHASGINPADTKRRSGWGGGSVSGPREIPHYDGAGVIDAVGGGVDAGRVGQRVWVHSAWFGREYGTAAQYVVVPEQLALPLPDGTSFEAGACLGIPALTAHQVVFSDGPVEGKTVLVTGGAGAVGHYAIQLAKWGGARVIATVSSPEKAELAREAGADEVLNYRTEDVSARVAELTGGEGVDRVIEVAFGENVAKDVELLKVGGTIASYASDAAPEPALPFYPLLMKNAAVRISLVFLMEGEPLERAIADVTRLLEQGVLRHNVALVLPLEQIAAAHEAIEAGSVAGNVVLTVD